jgi:hypothetical protein
MKREPVHMLPIPNSQRAFSIAGRKIGVAIVLFGLCFFLGCDRQVNPAAAAQLPALEFADAWGTRGTAPGQLESPVGIAADGFGDVYIADAATHSINKFTPKGGPLLSFSYAALSRPGGIAVDRGGGIYASNENRILVYWPEGDFLRATHGGPKVALRDAAGIAVGDEGDFYVVDRAACRVESFNWRGKFKKAWGQCGSANGEFLAPSGAAVGHDGSVFVADSGGARVQEFSPDGVFIATFGQAPSAGGEPASAQSNVAAVAVSAKNVFAAGGAASPLRVWSLDGAEIPLDPAVLQAAHLTPDFHVSALAYDFHSGDLLLLDAQACRVLRIHLHL